MWPGDDPKCICGPDETPCAWCDSWRGSLGLEPTIDLYLEHLVGVFDAVRRVLRDDGTLWVNLGDSYSGAPVGSFNQGSSIFAGRDLTGHEGSGALDKRRGAPGLKPLDCCNVPFRFALAMQAAGWYHRSTIIWAKGLSFCDSYSGSVMPESVSGWRWERCPNWPEPDSAGHGCDKCRDSGGYVLHKGSWRPTSAYEFVFMFAKTADYFCDGDAVREESERSASGNKERRFEQNIDGEAGIGHSIPWEGSSRNPRNVWVINPQPFPDAHFATFPEALIEPIIKVSTSEKGVCPECGSPWARVVETERVATRPTDTPYKDSAQEANKDHGRHVRESKTLGWRPTCGCVSIKTIETGDCVPPATILDCFAGSGTSLLVARKLGRHSVGIELSAQYADMARKRLADYAPLFQAET